MIPTTEEWYLAFAGRVKSQIYAKTVAWSRENMPLSANQEAHMNSRHYIREWRKYRGRTMGEMAERLDVSLAVVSRVERGEQRYNQQILEKMAVILGCTASDLIMRDPNAPLDLEAPHLLHGLSPRDVAVVKAVIGALRDSGGDQ